MCMTRLAKSSFIHSFLLEYFNLPSVYPWTLYPTASKTFSLLSLTFFVLPFQLSNYLCQTHTFIALHISESLPKLSLHYSIYPFSHTLSTAHSFSHTCSTVIFLFLFLLILVTWNLTFRQSSFIALILLRFCT